jgi:hypothetical protein
MEFNLQFAGSALIGAGIAKLDNLTVGLILVGCGVVILVIKAVLNKFGIPIGLSK